MSSDKESQVQQTSERRAKLKRLVEEYTVKIGIGKLQPNNEVERYLNLTQNDIRRMTAEDCAEAAYIVSRAMTYIQLEMNRIQADVDWCEQYIEWLIAGNIQSVGSQYTPFNYKRALAIKQNDVAMELNKIIITAKAQLTSVAFVTNQLRCVLTSFEGLQQIKRNQKP